MKEKAAVIDWESGVSDQTGPSSVNIQDAGVKTAFRCLSSILSWINPAFLCSHPNILAYDWWQTSLLAAEQTVTVERRGDDKYTVE